MPQSPHSLLPGTLEPLLRERSAAALAAGALRPIETATHFIEEGGVRFLVRVVSNLARKAASAGPDRSSPVLRRNPFLPYEEAMFVADLSPTHVALLNKFNVIERHLLIVTRKFVHQETLLDQDDFHALGCCRAEFPSLGFYNGGAAAGASQRHKHLQLVPLPLAPDGAAIPLEPLLMRAAAGGRGGVEQLATLPFAHAFAPLDPGRDLRGESSAREELALYRACLARLGIEPVAAGGPARQSAPYNLLLTRDWMLVVPRVRECCDGISINALGFAGSLFLRDVAQLRRVRALGPMTLLRAVSGG